MPIDSSGVQQQLVDDIDMDHASADAGRQIEQSSANTHEEWMLPQLATDAGDDEHARPEHRAVGVDEGVEQLPVRGLRHVMAEHAQQYSEHTL